MDDEKILELFFARDEQAVVETDRKYGRYCFTLANAILPSPEDAEEAVSDTYLHTWNAIPPKRPKVLRLFLARIVRNLSFDRWRHSSAGKRGGGELELALEELGECIPAPGDVEERLNAKELHRSIRQFLGTLSQRDRSIFLRRYFYVEEIGAIAQRCGMQSAAVRKVLLRTREKLRNYLQKEGVCNMKKEDLFLAIGMTEDKYLLESERIQAQPRKGKTMRKLLTLAAVVALLAGLAVTASATGLLNQIIAKLSPAEKPGEALGDAYSGSISAEKPEMFSAFGVPIEMPDMERVEVDPAEAERLMGEYVSSAEGSIEAGGNTIRLKNFVMDEIGLGAVTFTIENPNGVPYEDAGYGVINLGGVPGQSLWEPYVGMKNGDGSEESVNNWNYLISAEEDALEVVMYVGTLSDPIPGQPLTLHFSYGADYEKADIEITPLSFAPAITLTEEGGKILKLSSQGIAITCDSDTEWSTRRLVVHLADGTEYMVKGEGVYNHNLGYWRATAIEETVEDQRKMIRRTHYDEIMYLFNRLIDPAQVTSVELDYVWTEAIVHRDGTKREDIENIEHKETLVYYPG